MALPKKIFVYEYEDGGEKYLTAVRNLDEIPDDQDGTLVGMFTLTKKGKLVVTKEVTLVVGLKE